LSEKLSHIRKEIYRKIAGFFPDIKDKENCSRIDLKAEGINDIYALKLDRKDGNIDLILANFTDREYKVSDPEYKILVNPDREEAQVISFTNPSYSKVVYPVYAEIPQEVQDHYNKSLSTWLDSLKTKGYISSTGPSQSL